MSHYSFDPRIEIYSWQQAMPVAYPIRYQVFVIEQNVPEHLEMDEWDDVSLHALAFDETQQAIGTARLLPDGRIGRMAVLAHARSAGVGSHLLRALMQKARDAGMSEVHLHAQCAARDFYLRHGFVAQGDIFEEAGIQHVSMLHIFTNS